MKSSVSSAFSSFLLCAALCLASPLMAAEPLKVVESETGFYYTIQKGDTLWDLSQRFSDSPWLWPELWEENDQISNPHWIFPGERIRLYKKAGQQIVTKKDSPDRKPPAAATQNLSKAPSTPQDDKQQEGPYFSFTAIDRVGFIRKPPVQPLGTIYEVQGSKTLISEGDTVYIQPVDASATKQLIPGSRHTVYKTMAPTDDAHSVETIGTQHYILGVVEVVEQAPDLVTASVLKSYRTIRKEDLIMPFQPRHTRIQVRPSTPGVDGRIIVSEDHSTLTGDYTLAFVDKGRLDDIEIGQLYRIYKNKKTTVEKDEVTVKNLPPVDFGTFFVLHTEATTSTVVITQASDNISAGERFRTPLK